MYNSQPSQLNEENTDFKMRIKGLEPSLLAKPEPKSGASTNSAISAHISKYSISSPQSKLIRSIDNKLQERLGLSVKIKLPFVAQERITTVEIILRHDPIDRLLYFC